MNKVKVSIVGASGYTGGELLRLLLFHPNVEVNQVTSESYTGKFVHKIHPNLRKSTTLKFVSVNELVECDLLFLCLPHNSSQNKIEEFKKLAPKIIDLSADFRLKDIAEYEKWYGHKHARPDLLNEFVYGIPELHRDEMKKANYISSADAMQPLVFWFVPSYKNGLIEEDRTVIEVKAGSSEGEIK
jgi:N-acetyl-gamma-glutamyl-phosphate/LysW-gamma-L-alpha-aminoadipyl-6-phosphate reductase